MSGYFPNRSFLMVAIIGSTNRKSKIKSKIGPLEKRDGILTNPDLEVANIVNGQYRLAFRS